MATSASPIPGPRDASRPSSTAVAGSRFGTCQRDSRVAGQFQGSTPDRRLRRVVSEPEPGPTSIEVDADQEALARPHGDDRVRGRGSSSARPEWHRADDRREATADVDHEHRARPAGRPPRAPARDRGARARLRPRLLRHDLRGPRLRRALRDRRPGRVPDPLPALAVRHGVRAALQGLSLRAPEDLRDGHQQRPLLRLPAALQPVGRPEARHGPRLRPQRLLQEQHLVQPDQPQDDGRDGQPRQPHPLVHGAATARTPSRTSSTVACRWRT